MGNELQIIERSPSNDVAFGKKAAKALMDVVKEQGLARKFGGQKEHLYVEAWQLLGQFMEISGESLDAEFCEIDGVKGAKARAILKNSDGMVIGGAEAYCMRDEGNWRNKPWFQLASMAQTRAVSKAFRNRLSWIAVLAGYSGTPAEEMDGVNPAQTPSSPEKTPPRSTQRPTEAKKELTLEEKREKMVQWLNKKGKGINDGQDYLKKSYTDWDEMDMGLLTKWGQQGFPVDNEFPDEPEILDS